MMDSEEYYKHDRRAPWIPKEKEEDLGIQRLQLLMQLYEPRKKLLSYLNDYETYVLQCATYAFEKDYIYNIKTLSQVQYVLLAGLFPNTLLENIELDGDFIRNLLATRFGHMILERIPIPPEPEDMIKTDILDDYPFIVQVTKNLCKDKFNDKPMVYVRIGTTTDLPFYLINCSGLKLIQNLEKYTVVIIDWDEFYESFDKKHWENCTFFLTAVLQMRQNFRIAFIFSTRYLRRTCCIWLEIALPLNTLKHTVNNLATWYFACTPVFNRDVPKELPREPTNREDFEDLYDWYEYKYFERYGYVGENVFCCNHHFFNYENWNFGKRCRSIKERKSFRLEFGSIDTYFESRKCCNKKGEVFTRDWRTRLHYILEDYLWFSPILFNTGVCAYGLIKNDPMVTVTHEYYKITNLGHFDNKDTLLMLPRQKFVYKF